MTDLAADRGPDGRPIAYFAERNPARPRALAGRAVEIVGTGSHLPGDPISTSALLESNPVDTTTEWVETHTGIRQRHWADPALATSDLAEQASRTALEDAGCDATDIEQIIVCTTTPDYPSPATASRLQELLGARCPAHDVNAACASWMYGIDHGVRLVQTGLDRVLVVGADIKSRFVSSTDRRLMPVLADGAGAVVLGPERIPSNGHGPTGVLALELFSDGGQFENMITPAGGSMHPASSRTIEEDLHSTRMQIDGQIVKRHAVQIMSDLVRQACAKCGVSTADLALLVPHQANLAIIEAVREELEMESDRVAVTIDHTGNVVAAALPVAFDEALRARRIGPGDLVVFATVGAGYAGGVMLYRIPEG